MQRQDCMIIGGGAAGLFCASVAGQRGRSVTVLDHANKVGKKILMSGGGRCNFTNYFVEPENFISNNPHFCKSALSRFTQYDFLELVHDYQVAYHEKTLGQLFCDHKAKAILALLLAECDKANVTINTQYDIQSVEHYNDPKYDVRFKITTSKGVFICQSLVIATGGLSIPTMGATGLGYDLAKQFGLRITPRHAALVPFTLKDNWLLASQSLAGVSLPVLATVNQQSFREALLFTHKGLSGPAMLQLSNYWYPGDEISINFLPEQNLLELCEGWQKDNTKATLKNVLARYLPKRFVHEWIAHYPQLQALNNKAIAQWSRSDQQYLADTFHTWRIVPAGTEGYKTAEVTRGGVHTDDVSSKTFEANTTPGLFFVGEVLDVTGWLGGYNFQWAWASGYCAAQYV